MLQSVPWFGWLTRRLYRLTFSSPASLSLPRKKNVLFFFKETEGEHVTHQLWSSPHNLHHSKPRSRTQRHTKETKSVHCPLFRLKQSVYVVLCSCLLNLRLSVARGPLTSPTAHGIHECSTAAVTLMENVDQVQSSNKHKHAFNSRVDPGGGFRIWRENNPHALPVGKMPH